jgi:hypothetical protein
MNDAPGYSTAMPGFSGGFGVPGGGGGGSSQQQQGVNPQAGLQQGSNRNGVGLGLPSGLMVSGCSPLRLLYVLRCWMDCCCRCDSSCS